MERIRRALDASPDRVCIAYATSASGMMCKYAGQGCEEILDDLDLKAEERSELGRDNGRVVDQSNGPGSLVDHGTTIVLKTL